MLSRETTKAKFKIQMSKLKSSWRQLWLEHRYNFLGALTIFLIAIFLRTYNIFSIPIFADEAIYIRWAQVMKAESTLRFLPLSDGKQPLFMWTVIPFLKAFQDPLVAGRSVSIACGMLSLVGIFLFTLNLFKSRKTALLAAFFWAISPFAVFFDRMALVDSMLTVFGIWSIYWSVLMVKYLRLDTAMLAGFALGFAWLTKSPAVFFLILMPISFVFRIGQKLVSFQTVKLIGLWSVSLIIAFGLYNILRLGPNFHMIALRNQDYVFPLSHAWTNPWDPFQFHIREIIEWFWVLIPGSVLILAVLGIAWGLKKYWREFLLLGAWCLGPLLVEAELAKVFTARYILFTIPPIFIFAALFLTNLEKINRKFFLVMVLLVSIPAFWMDYLLLTKPEQAPLPRVERSGYLEAWTAGTGIREVAFYIKQEHQKSPDEKITVGTEGYFGTLPDGLQIYIEDLPNVTVKGIGVSVYQIDSSLINAKKAGDRVYLLVNQSRLEADPETLGIQLVNSYPKAIKPDGTRDSLLLFEVLDHAVEIYNIKNAKST